MFSSYRGTATVQSTQDLCLSRGGVNRQRPNATNGSDHVVPSVCSVLAGVSLWLTQEVHRRKGCCTGEAIE